MENEKLYVTNLVQYWFNRNTFYVLHCIIMWWYWINLDGFEFMGSIWMDIERISLVIIMSIMVDIFGSILVKIDSLQFLAARLSFTGGMFNWNIV